MRCLAHSRPSVNGHCYSRASLLMSPLFLGPISHSSLPESVLMDWWFSEIPSAGSGVAGRHRVQAAEPSLPGPFWETLWLPYCTQSLGSGAQNSWLRPEWSISGCCDNCRAYLPGCHPGSLDRLPWHPVHAAFHPLTPHQHCLMHVWHLLLLRLALGS